MDDSAQNSNSIQTSHGKFVDETAEKILRQIYVMFQITEEGLLSYRRDRKHTKARQAAVYLLKQLTSLSLSEIGKIVGRNHSTIHATLKKVGERMSVDGFFLKQMQTFLIEFEEIPVSGKDVEQKRHFRF